MYVCRGLLATLTICIYAYMFHIMTRLFSKLINKSYIHIQIIEWSITKFMIDLCRHFKSKEYDIRSELFIMMLLWVNNQFSYLVFLKRLDLSNISTIQMWRILRVYYRFYVSWFQTIKGKFAVDLFHSIKWLKREEFFFYCFGIGSCSFDLL